MTTVWLAQRKYESDIVYENIFNSKSKAKKELANVQGNSDPEDFNWEGLNYEGDESVKATDSLELHECLIVKRYTV